MSGIGVTVEPNLGVWEDMGMYWAWRNTSRGTLFHPSPTVKRLEYEQVGNMRICSGVWDDDVFTSLNQEEICKLIQQRAHENI